MSGRKEEIIIVINIIISDLLSQHGSVFILDFREIFRKFSIFQDTYSI